MRKPSAPVALWPPTAQNRKVGYVFKEYLSSAIHKRAAKNTLDSVLARLGARRLQHTCEFYRYIVHYLPIYVVGWATRGAYRSKERFKELLDVTADVDDRWTFQELEGVSPWGCHRIFIQRSA